MSRVVTEQQRLPRWRATTRVLAALVPAVVCMLLATVRDHVTAATCVLVMVLCVVAAAATGDRVAGLLAALSSGASFDFFLTEPYDSFTISGADDVEATVLLVLISLAVTEITLWGHRQREQASRHTGYLEGVLGTARAVAEGALPADAVVDVVASEIADVLGVEQAGYVEGPVRDNRVALLDHDGDLTRGGHPVDVGRAGFPTDEYVAVPVRRGTVVVGHFLLSSATRTVYPSVEQRQVAVLLADQVAVAVAEGRS
jgi:K+-sensing histidine kinase KdpD